MSNYSKLVDYAAKDALITGNPAKLVKGTELGAEFDAIAVAVATKLDSSGGTDLAVADGGTGASTAADARTNLGLAIGTNVQAYDATLTAFAGGLTAANKIPYATALNTLGELDFKDEDNMASDSATAVPSQQSVKAYVDTQVATVNGITLGTPAASTSGTEVPFGSIPAGTKRITIMLDGVSTNSTAGLLLQIGDSGGLESSGYVSACSRTTAVATSTIGYILIDAMQAAATLNGSITITLLNASTNAWVCSSNLALSGSSCASGAGAKSLSGELTQLRLVATNGTDAFDAGSVNIAYE